MTKEKIRKIIILSFIGLGLILAVYEAKKPGPSTVVGSGTGYNDEISVELKVKSNGKIIGVNIIHEDTPPIADPAVENLKKEILKKQSADLDIYAGATYTSNGIKEAVEDALEKIKK